MKIDSPSSITPREASIRLEWISTRILPGVAVLLLSIPLCQWAGSNLPDDIVPVSIIYSFGLVPTEAGVSDGLAIDALPEFLRPVLDV